MPDILTETLMPSSALLERLAGEPPLSVSSCYRCKKCSSGCPLTFAVDLLLGQEEQLLSRPPGENWLAGHLVAPRPLLQRKGLLLWARTQS